MHLTTAGLDASTHTQLRRAIKPEFNQTCAATLVQNPYIHMKCEGRRWYVWNGQAWKWERATVVHGVSHHIVREVERLIIQAVREDDFEEARIWRRYLYHGDIGIRLTPHISRILRAH